MASRYRQPALTIRRRVIDRLLWLPLILLLSPVTTSGAAGAGKPTVELRPYVAEYKTKARGFNLNITRQLETSENDSYVLTNRGRILVGGFHEVSVFSVQDRQILPKSYVYRGTGLVDRRREVHFSQATAGGSRIPNWSWWQKKFCRPLWERSIRSTSNDCMMTMSANPIYGWRQSGIT